MTQVSYSEADYTWVLEEDSEKREQEYLKIINSYTKEEQALFPKMIASVVNSLSIEKYNDVLGTLFEELGLHNKFKGQFFTPNDVSYLIAEINSIYVEEIKDDIKNYGYFKLNDCACGSGRLFYSYLKMMKENNIDYNSQVFIEAQDISSVCVYMTYIQLSLYGVCAKVIHGDTLLNEIYDVFYTPMTIKYPFRFRDELK
ncbi:MAG: SAM-dependent methyltransferase, partial [Bacilli bacterium]|nr:SAM-dependent methyltransferase [Bacilli bacterium]